MNRRVEIPFPPKRIISLVPSQTELLASLGLEQEVIGITKFCVHPEKWFRTKTRVGGTKDFKLERITQLRPDLIIGNKEENDRKKIRSLSRDFPIWMSDILNFEQAVQMIRSIGEICDREKQAGAMADQILQRFADLQSFPPLRTAYFIWQNPFMVAASDTFINDMLQKLGLENVFGRKKRYPEISAADLQQQQPELILLSSEPYPFGQKHIDAFRDLCPRAVIKLVDGTLFSWYGSRLLEAPNYFEFLRKSIQA
ncbi:MAG: ABC transporter substrate-binding protein [Saprospiraceae bacterium]|nr:ABC transporter substrate-binding protein [Saprospiraceae bacterium]